MNARIFAAAVAVTLSAAPVVQAQNMDMGFDMLTGAVFNALSAQGFDTSNIHELTLAEIATIKSLLEGGMDGEARGSIAHILDSAEG